MANEDVQNDVCSDWEHAYETAWDYLDEMQDNPTWQF